MSVKRAGWALATVVTAGATAGAVFTGVTVQRAYAHLNHDGAAAVPSAAAPAVPAPPQPADAPARDALRAALDAAAGREQDALGTFGAQVIDLGSGEVVWERDASKALVPASSTKVLTAMAASWALPADHIITTNIVAGAHPGEVVIKAAGDVWLTPEQLDAAAEELRARAQESGTQSMAVFIDTSAWSGPEQGQKWDPENVDAGFVAPMQPAMIHGARLGESTGDVPRSHTPALDVAQALADRLGAGTVGTTTAPADAPVLASIESAPLHERADQMMKHSDNVAAEAIGRELAAARGEEASFGGATRATLEVLAEHGVDVSRVFLADNSGLSDLNRIPPAVLAGLIKQAASENPAVISYLPVAGGDGTLFERYADGSGAEAARGMVRAKTGTLTGTSALVGTSQGEHDYAFAFLVNDGDILAARAAEDHLATILHEH